MSTDNISLTGRGSGRSTIPGPSSMLNPPALPDPLNPDSLRNAYAIRFLTGKPESFRTVVVQQDRGPQAYLRVYKTREFGPSSAS